MAQRIFKQKKQIKRYDGVDSVAVMRQPSRDSSEIWAWFFVLFICVGTFFVRPPPFDGIPWSSAHQGIVAAGAWLLAALPGAEFMCWRDHRQFQFDAQKEWGILVSHAVAAEVD